MTDIDFDKLTELVKSYQNGDSGAFEQIYNMTYRTAKFTALKILNNNESDADDVMQDCYIKAMQKIDTLKTPSSFMSWFNMIIANQAKSVIRKNNPRFYEKDKDEDYSHLEEEWEKEFGGFDQYDYDDYSDNGEDIGESKKLAFIDEASSDDYESFLPESEIEQEELCKIVMDMIENLSEEKKTAVILFYYNNMTTREISESIGVSENTVKSRLVQAKKDLSKAVSAYETKNGKLLAVSPASLVVWALKSSSATVSVTPFVATGIAAGTAAGTAAASSAVAGTGIVTKIIAGVVIAGVVAGGGVVGSREVKKHRADEERTTAVVDTCAEPSTSEFATSTTEPTSGTSSVIPSRPIEEYTVAPNKKVDTYYENGTLKYGVEYVIQRFANRTDNGVSVYSGRPALNRYNYKASYEELLPAAKENRSNFNGYISESVSEINKKRTDSGRKALIVDDTLTEQANVRAEEVAWSLKDTAIRPDGSSFTTIFDRNGFSKGSRDEIRCVNYSSYNSAVEAILKNEKINGDFEKIGVGVAKNPENDKFVFVIHLYSSQPGKSDESITDEDRINAWRDDLASRVENFFLDMSDYDKAVEELKKVPLFKEFLESDVNIDGFLQNLDILIGKFSDYIERRGE